LHVFNSFGRNSEKKLFKFLNLHYNIEHTVDHVANGDRLTELGNIALKKNTKKKKNSGKT